MSEPEETPFDADAFQAELDISFGTISRIVDSWVPSALRSAPGPHKASTNITAFQSLRTREPRLGLGATPKQTAAEYVADAKLKYKLAAKRKAAEENPESIYRSNKKHEKNWDNATSPGDSDEEDSRANAIGAKPRASTSAVPAPAPAPAPAPKPHFNPPSPTKPTVASTADQPPPTPLIKKTVAPVSFYAGSGDGLSKRQLKKLRREQRLATAGGSTGGEAGKPPSASETSSDRISQHPAPLKPDGSTDDTTMDDGDSQSMPEGSVASSSARGEPNGVEGMPGSAKRKRNRKKKAKGADTEPATVAGTATGEPLI